MINKIFKYVLFFSLSLACTPILSAHTYFINVSSGNDSFDGMTEMTAWKTLAKVNGTTFVAGDSILLKCGETWSEYLHPAGSGVIGNPIVISSYGTGNKPQINTGGSYPTAVLLLNQEYWVIENLDVTNLHPTNNTSSRYGVYIISNNYGVVRHIILRNLVVHDVNGNPGSKTCGGIFFEVMGGTTAWFDSVIVEGCDVYDVSPVGIASTSSLASRTLTTNSNWYPSTNIYIRNNMIRRTVRNGMIIRVAKRPVIEHNVFQECAKDSSGNAMFVFNCDSALIQYNEAFLTRFNAGDEDAGGFDGDYRCKSTIIQYNYTHHNEYGGIVVVSDGSGTDTFNDGAIIRYNVLKDNSNHCIRVSGNVTNTTFYNNTIYSSTAAGAVVAVWHKSWGGYCDNTKYYNNIFELQKYGSSFQLNSSTNNLFDYNLFHGVRAAGEPADLHKMTADPKFAAPDSVSNGWTTAAGLRLQSTSPAIDSGTTLSGHVAEDYLGTAIPTGSQVDRGAFEFPGTSGFNEDRYYPGTPKLFGAYPNPFNPTVVIPFYLDHQEYVSLIVHDILGRTVSTLIAERLGPGFHQVTFDGHGLPSGIYFYTLDIGRFSETKQIVLVK
jgi:hypothetical protein